MHHNFVDLVKGHGMERAKAMFQAAVHAADAVERIITEEKIDCGFERCGHIEAASKPAHFKKLMEEQEALERAMGFKTQIVPREAMANEIATTVYDGLTGQRAQWKSPAGEIRAGIGIRSGTRRSRHPRSDARHRESSERETRPRITESASRFTRNGELLMPKDVFVASNAWIGEIVPQFRSRVFPAESFIIATEPLREDLVQRLIPHKRVIFDTKNMLSYYRFSDDNRMVFGGRDALISASAKGTSQACGEGCWKFSPSCRTRPLIITGTAHWA